MQVVHYYINQTDQYLNIFSLSKEQLYQYRFTYYIHMRQNIQITFYTEIRDYLNFNQTLLAYPHYNQHQFRNVKILLFLHIKFKEGRTKRRKKEKKKKTNDPFQTELWLFNLKSLRALLKSDAWNKVTSKPCKNCVGSQSCVYMLPLCIFVAGCYHYNLICLSVTFQIYLNTLFV